MQKLSNETAEGKQQQEQVVARRKRSPRRFRAVGDRGKPRGQAAWAEDDGAVRQSAAKRALSRQLIDGSAGVLIAQAKQLERGLRAELERLVRAVNEEGKQQQGEEEKSPEAVSVGLLAEVRAWQGSGASAGQVRHSTSLPLARCWITVGSLCGVRRSFTAGPLRRQ